MMDSAKAQVWYKLTHISIMLLCLMLFISFSATALSHIFILAPALYYMLKAIKYKKLQFSGSMIALVFVILISILSVVLGDVDRPLKHLFKLKYFFVGLLSVWVLRYSFANYFNEKRVKILISVALVAVSIATLSGLIGLWSGFNPLRFKDACHPSRACGMYGMYMTYGYGIGFVVMLLMGLWLFFDDLKLSISKNLVSIALFINMVGLILAKARGSIIAFLLCFPLFFINKSKKAVAIAYLIVFIGSIILGTTSIQVKNFMASPDRVFSVEVRLSHYKAAYAAFKENPWFGVGYRNFEPSEKMIKVRNAIPYPNITGHAHNNFLEHLASTGMLGMVAIILFHLLWFMEMLRRKDCFGRIFMPFICFLAISGMAQYTLGDGENMFLIMFIYSLSQAIPIPGGINEYQIP